jgi:hypothetical protein
MALNTQIFQRTDNRDNEARKSNSSEKTPHTPTLQRKPKENLDQSSQSHYNSHFNLNKQAYTQHEAALQREQTMPRATL